MKVSRYFVSKLTVDSTKTRTSFRVNNLIIYKKERGMKPILPELTAYK